MSEFWKLITENAEKKPYGMILTEELPGTQAVKVTDDLYFFADGGECFVVDRKAPARIRKALSEFPDSDELSGFSTELSFAPQVILKARFERGQMILSDSVFAVSEKKLTDKLAAVLLHGGGDILLVDTSRFLLYAYSEGRYICGTMEV